MIYTYCNHSVLLICRNEWCIHAWNYKYVQTYIYTISRAAEAFKIIHTLICTLIINQIVCQESDYTLCRVQIQSMGYREKNKGWLKFGERVIFIVNGRKRGGPQEGQFLKGWSPLQRGKILIVNKCCAQWSSDQYFLVVSCNCWFELDCM